MFRSTLLKAAIVSLGLTLGSQAQKPFDLKDKLPPETLLYMGAPDIMQSITEFQSMPLWKLWKEEEVQEFFAKPLQMLQGFIAMGQSKGNSQLKQMGLGITVDDLLAIRPEACHLAVIGTGGMGEPVRFAVTFKVSEGKDAIDKLVGFGFQMLEAQRQMMGERADRFLPSIVELAGGKALVMDTTRQDGPFKSLTVYYKEGLFLVASSESLAKTLLSETTGASLTGAADYKRCFSHLRAKGCELEFFMRPAKLITQTIALLKTIPERDLQDFFEGRGEMLEKGLEASGLMGLKAVGMASTYDNGKAYWDGFCIAPSPRKGLVGIFDGMPLDKNLLAWVPKNVQSCSMGSLPLKKLIDSILSIVTSVNEQVGQQAAGGLAMLKKQIGIDVQADLIDQINGTMIYYAKGASNLMSPAPIILMIQVKDYKKILNSLETLLGMTEGMVGLKESQDPVSGKKFWKLEVDPDALGNMRMQINPLAIIQPCFTFHKGFWILSMTPSTLSKAVAQMDGKQKGDIRDRKEMARLLETMPEEITSINFFDWKGFIENYYGLLSSLAPMLPIGEDVPIDLDLLPDPETMAKHFFPQTGYAVINDKGFLSRSTSPIGPEVILGIGGGAAAAGAMVAKRKAMRSSPFGPTTGRFPKRTGKRAAQNFHFDTLSAGLIIYNVEYNKYPDSLKDLLKPTENYPNGFLTGEMKTLPKDPWGHAYCYEKTKDGYRLWSIGSNGIDENGKGDDITRNR